VYEVNQWAAAAKGELRVRLNGTLVTTRKIGERGRQVQSIALPVGGLTLGNTLTLEFASDAVQGKSTESAPEENVSHASAVDLSGLAHFVELPRLDLFANAGFPFTKQADLATTAIVLSEDASPAQLGFYLDVMGFFGARTGYPALRVSVISPVQTAEATGKDLLILSTGRHSEALNQLILGPATVDQGQIRLREPASLLHKLPGLSWVMSSAPRQAEEVVSADPAPDGFISEFERPVGGHTAVVIQAADISKLEPLEDVFAGEATVAQVYGSLSFLQGGQFHSFLLGPKSYGQGSLGGVARFEFWMISSYWTLPVFLFAIAALLAFSFNRWLEERARFRLKAEL
jgi:cellulose synthase (UDP-forming)